MFSSSMTECINNMFELSLRHDRLVLLHESNLHCIKTSCRITEQKHIKKCCHARHYLTGTNVHKYDGWSTKRSNEGRGTVRVAFVSTLDANQWTNSKVTFNTMINIFSFLCVQKRLQHSRTCSLMQWP